jgi:5-hydroxyisourate hydrolase
MTIGTGSITTHVLDTALGKPASGISVRLDRLTDGAWAAVSESATDADGRCRDLADDTTPGQYRLTFSTGPYFARSNRSSIYPEISIVFLCAAGAHYHLPLLLSDNSYTTYRGS